MNLNKIINEWFYRLPKGYANKPYTPEELAELRTVLKENNYSNEQSSVIIQQLREAEDSASNLIRLISDNPDYDDLQPVTDKTSIKRFTNNNPTQIKIYFRGLPTRGSGREVGYEVLQDILDKKGVQARRVKELIKGSSMGYLEVVFNNETFWLVVKGTGGTGTTSTDVKENMIILCYHSKITTSVNETTFPEIHQSLINGLTSVPNIPAKQKNELEKFVKALNNNSRHHKILNDFVSVSRSITATYPDKTLTRGKLLFDDLRQIASSITKVPPDKWNPGDVYVVLSTDNIQIAINHAKSHNKVEFLNELFVNEWGSLDAPLVSVSLKQARAQGGKAKSYLQKYATSTSDYNLTPKEIDASEEEKRKMIDDYRETIKRKTTNNPNIKYNFQSGELESSKVNGKLAAVKALAFFLDTHESETDEAIVALAGYGMSLSGVNPTFFKLIGNTSGEPSKPVKYNAGGQPILYIDDDFDYEPVIIDDKTTMAGINIHLKIKNGEKAYDVLLSARQNGLVQGTIEIAKIKPIGDG